MSRTSGLGAKSLTRGLSDVAAWFVVAPELRSLRDAAGVTGRAPVLLLPPPGAFPRTAHHPPRLEAVDQLHRRVMAHEQPRGERVDRGGRPRLERLELEQRHVLLGLDPRRAGGLLADLQEAADLIAEVR